MKRMMLLIGMGLGLLVALASERLAAQEVFSACYRFDQVTTASGPTDPTPLPAVPGVVFGPVQAVGYSGNPSRLGEFSWRGNELGGINGCDDFADFTGHLNQEKYYELMLAPETGWVLDLDQITFTVSRSAAGIRSYAVRSSLDEFAANLPGFVSSGNTNLAVAADNSYQWLFDATPSIVGQPGSRVLLGDAFAALTHPVTFRFYGWNAETTNGLFSIDTVYFQGSVGIVPEPGPMVWLALGFILVGAKRLQRRKMLGGRKA